MLPSFLMVKNYSKLFIKKVKKFIVWCVIRCVKNTGTC